MTQERTSAALTRLGKRGYSYAEMSHSKVGCSAATFLIHDDDFIFGIINETNANKCSREFEPIALQPVKLTLAFFCQALSAQQITQWC